jgi:hypothetical protein
LTLVSIFFSFYSVILTGSSLNFIGELDGFSTDLVFGSKKGCSLTGEFVEDEALTHSKT